MKRIVCLAAVLVMLLTSFILPVAGQAETAANTLPGIEQQPLRTWYLNMSFKQYQMKEIDGYSYVRFKIRNDSNFALTKFEFQFVTYKDEYKIETGEKFKKTVKCTIKAHKTGWTKWIKLTHQDGYYINKMRIVGGGYTWGWYDNGSYFCMGSEWEEY